MEQTRAFLAENRQSMVGIFKRFAKIGGVGTADHHGALSDLAKCYMTLISATNFLEVCTQPATITADANRYPVRGRGSEGANSPDIILLDLSQKNTARVVK
jgi:nuclear pore complex protein Nup205